MATSSQEQFSSLGRLEEEHRQQEQLVEHVRALLSRADSRREAEPENRRKWNRVLDNLESALSEAKVKLERCELCLRREREWHQLVEESSPLEDLPPTPCISANDAVAMTEEIDGDPQAAEAARRLLDTPLESVEKAPLEQVALAQRYLASRQQSGVVNGVDRRLAGRVELAIQGRNPLPMKPAVLTRTVEERRHQKALREVVGKIQRNRLNALTIQDLELAVECCMVLSQRMDLDQTEVRLRELLLRGLHDAEQILKRLRNRAGL